MLRRKGRIAPAKRPFKTVLAADMLAYIASGLSIFFTFDQIRMIWIDHNAAGVSIVAWCFYFLSSAVWLFYGIVHRDRVLKIVNTTWLFLNFSIALGAYLYS
jgi:uncharacterized protein with PQ loop repeat